MAIARDEDLVIQKLLDAGASIYALGSNSNTRLYSCDYMMPLTAAIIQENGSLVETLIIKGASISNLANPAENSMTSLAAVENRNYELVGFLL